MAFKEIFGTDFNDTIRTPPLTGAYLAYGGFYVYGGGGDDTLTSIVNYEAGQIDVLDGGDGNDLLTATGNYFTSKPPGAAFIYGGKGADKLLLFSSLNEGEYPRFQLEEKGIFFAVPGANLNIFVDYQTEILALLTKDTPDSSRFVYYLTEDISRGITRGLSSEEVERRTTGVNMDWFLNKLDTRFTISLSSISINEGSTLTTSVATANVATVTKLYYAVSGTGITTADFSAGGLTGEGVTDATGKFIFSHTLANDLTTEGVETLSIKLYSDVARTVQVGSTANVSISDTSVTPAPTYTLTPSTATINEGAVLTSTVAIANVAAGTKFYYALSGTGITTTDFSAGALTGEGTTDATGKFTFTHTLANDLITEGPETLNIKLFSDSSRTIQVGNIGSVSIDDTSGTPTPVINKTTSIHRFFNSKSGVHLYSPSNEEKDTIINNPAWGYKYEGVAYQAPLTGGTELYRFYNADKNYHFNTASTGEALSIIQNALGANYDLITGINQNPISGSWGFKYEGRSFRVSETKTEHNSTPVYRFFHAQKSVHFYSSSLIEVNNVIGMSNGEQYKDNFLAAAGAPLLNGGWGYKFEGVAWFI